jgi:hypothetical protein
MVLGEIGSDPANGPFFLTAFFDDLVKSLKISFFVIPAEAGIQYFQALINTLDSGFHRRDDFLRNHL